MQDTLSRLLQISAIEAEWFLENPLKRAKIIIPVTNTYEDVEASPCDSLTNSDRKNHISVGSKIVHKKRHRTKTNIKVYAFHENIRVNALHKRGLQSLGRQLLISCCHSLFSLLTRYSILSSVRTGKMSSFTRGLLLPSRSMEFIQPRDARVNQFAVS